MTKTKSLTFITIIGVLLLISVEVLSKFYHLFEEGLLIRIEIGLLALVILLVMNLVFHFSSIQAESIVEQVRAFEPRADPAPPINPSIPTGTYRRQRYSGTPARLPCVQCRLRRRRDGRTRTALRSRSNGSAHDDVRQQKHPEAGFGRRRRSK